MTQPRLVGGRYELGELIGYGGMAEVHRGRDTRLNRDVAIKVLRADLARDPSFINRFRREAHSAAGLNHPSIVSVYDTGEDAGADGTAVPFIVMEYVEGRTLRDVLKSEGKLPIRRAMEIVADICSALDFSHRNGIIHRDIKPANVMITPAGAVKVMDFGIARAVADTSATQTQTANVIGTAQYLSPEQARGESVDARSDVYSTGCLLYELVAGVPPFQGDSPVAVAYQHVREVPTPPSSRNPEVPRALDSVVMKALAKNQLNRYQSAGDMRSDLQRALANQPVNAETVMTDDERTQFIARTPPPVAPIRRPMYDDEEDHTRRTGLIWAAVVVALLLVIGLGTFLIFGSSNSPGKKDVAVPVLVGGREEAAVTALRSAGLVAVKGPATSGPCVPNGTVPPGYVCKTSPTAGTTLKEGDPVTYQLYTPSLVLVPFVEGMPYNEAVSSLLGHHLGMPKKEDVFQFDGKGTVIMQGTPTGTAVPPGTVIVIKVATGTQKLPDVIGETYNDALSTLTGLGWVSANIREDTTKTTTDLKKDQTVYKMTPKAGKYTLQGQAITLFVYRYKAPPVTCTTPPPTPTNTTSSPSSPAPGQSSSTATSPSPGTSTSTSPGALPPCTN